MDPRPPAAIRTVWVTRAEPGASRTAERLTALGFSPLVVPLLTVCRLSPRVDMTDVRALAFTSVNGVAAFVDLDPGRTLPVFTVGDATAHAAREAGFATATSAAGDVAALGALLRERPTGGVILHPTARDPAGDLAAAAGEAVTVRSVAVYETLETDADAPGAFDAVLIHSPRAGRALAGAVAPHATAALVAVAMSRACVPALATLSFAEVRIAARPDDAAMIAALGKPGPRV